MGRYLEHARIYSFFDGRETRVFIASGDFLTRNTECRVEVGVRIQDPVLVKKLSDILEMQLADNVNAREMNVNAREMQPDGSYQKVKHTPGEPLINSQMGMYELLKDGWTGARSAAAVPVTAVPVREKKAPVQPVAAPAAPVTPVVKPAPQPVAAAEPKPAEVSKPAETIVVVKEQPQGGLLSRLRKALFGDKD